MGFDKIMKYEYREKNELKRMIEVGNQFSSVVITAEKTEMFFVDFYIGSLFFRFCKQKRNDRDSGVRYFKTIDFAYKEIRNIGYGGDIVIR